MSVTLDGQILFDEQQPEIEPGSFSRASIERAVPGLEGVLSIDLGSRGRKIRQTGVLSANSRAQMNEKISAISAFMDGDIHTLVSGGEEFDNLRMDSLKISNERAGGNGVVVDYEIVYTQLKVQQ
ncbi:MAG: hypothetical protein NTX52_02770 [Planctomycetota bacterium]|jgi:hypothetical protein|nr:hypothetical protein [Planctomycetota bacterium]